MRQGAAARWWCCTGKISVRALAVLGSFKCRLQWAVECARRADESRRAGEQESGRALSLLVSSICIMAATHCSGNGNPKLTRGSLAGVHESCLWVARAACASSLGHIVSTSLPSPTPTLTPSPTPGNCSYSLPLVSGSCLHCRPFGSSYGTPLSLLFCCNEHELRRRRRLARPAEAFFILIQVQ